MKVVRRLIFFVALIVVIICVVLLLNFTAPNPTGRRYSSVSVQTSGGTQTIGLSGEQTLAQDLRAPRNDDPDQRQCICNDPKRSLVPKDCRVCIAYSQSIANYRRPDFVTEKYIAESKNTQNLLYTYDSTIDQIGDYAVAARAMNRPLWLYTRVDTHLDPEYYRMVESTGGGVVAYFTTPGYTDPVDQAARMGLSAAVALLAVMSIWELGARALASRQPRSPRLPSDPMTHAKHKTDHAEDFAKKAKEHQQRKIDIEDSRSDDLD